jgi:tripartite motif-containing protein 71
MLGTTRRVFGIAVLTASATALIATGSASAAYVQKRAWGVQGGTEGRFQSPQGVAIAPHKVYVADVYNRRIQTFDPAGTFLFTWGWGVQDRRPRPEFCTSSCRRGIPGRGYGQLHTPTGIAASRGYVYVADFQTSRIQRFRSNGRGAVVTWGSFGGGNTQFKSPAAVAADSSGHVYVADTGNNRVKKFSSTGSFLTKWGNAGSGDAQFRYPWGIDADLQGNVYVADTYNNRVEKFSASGKFLAKWGRRGSGRGQFQQPFGIATDRRGNVYVADSGNHLIEVFSPRGKLLAKWGKLGSGKGQFRAPQDIAVDGRGNVYVADSGNHRIVKYARVSG